MKLLLAGLLLASLSAVAHKGKQRSHHAHSHGSAQLTIAFDNLKGQVEIKGAAEGIVGFEHEAKSEKDKAALKNVIATFETKISQFIQFDSAAGCTFTKKTIEMVKEDTKSNHSDFVASFDINCTKSVQGSTIQFDFTSFPKMNDIDTTVLVNELQLKTEIKKTKTSLMLK